MTADLFPQAGFEPTVAAARARLAAVRPGEYARSRNHLEGAVTRLSPYITHGLLTLPEVLGDVLQRHRLNLQHKFVQELGWREFFHHVWAHEGEGILESLHEGPLPEAAYARELPADLREGRTGVPAIDAAVRELYATGWLHNHARMWLASYTVHLRKVHWRAGANWMYTHLLDGDLASNHLSWQWVAGTGSHKPYLFNAENVARYAPPHWHSPGTVVDRSYEELDEIARSPRARGGVGAPRTEGVPEPAPASGPGREFLAPDASAVRGRDVWLVHPWSLGEAPADLPRATLRVGVVVTPWHAAHPWSEGRWQFVRTRMQACSDLLWSGTPSELREALRAASSVAGHDDPHLAGALNGLGLRPPAHLFAWPERRCRSFSQFWQRIAPRDGEACTLLRR